MAKEDVVLNEYTYKELKKDAPVRKEYVSELRDNVQVTVNALDKHSGSRGINNHDIVTLEENGFCTPDVLSLIDTYLNELDEIESILSQDDFPEYGIAIWNGDNRNIPANWAICDGSKGTPDLRQRIPVSWSGARAIGSTGGSFTHSVDTKSLIGNHTHKFNNIVGVYTNTGKYDKYTRYGKWPTSQEIYPTGTNGIMWCIEETSSVTGTTTASGKMNFNVVTPYVCKWYIMRLPVTDTTPVKTFTITIEADDGATIVSNLGGPGSYTIRNGRQLAVSMSVNDEKKYDPDGLYVNGTKLSQDVIMYVRANITIRARVIRRS